MSSAAGGETSLLEEAEEGDGVRNWQAEQAGGLPGVQVHQEERELLLYLP